MQEVVRNSKELENEDPTFVPTPEEFAESSMCNYFKGKTIFLTGATGFLGRLYLEKLLRCKTEKIYILARAKKNVKAAERIRDIFCAPVFSLLQKQDPTFFNRIQIIEGDLSQRHAGMQESDVKLLENTVEIVLHAGANVKFNEKLSNLIFTNLRGTRDLLLMAEGFQKLEVFAYVSTAYSNCSRGKNIYEKFYEPPLDPEEIISYLEMHENDPQTELELEVLTDRIILPWPNTYSYSKSLSEEVVKRYGKKFPTCVLRPSIVISTYKEPLPAWSNAYYGLNGMIFSIGLGFVRVVLGDDQNPIDVVCADVVINATLAVIWSTHLGILNRNIWNKQMKENDNQVPEIYNICSSVENPVITGTIWRELMKQFEDNPSCKVLWAICSNITSSSFMLRYLNIIYHLIPHSIADFFFWLTRQEMRLMPLTRKCLVFTVALSYFSAKEWRFHSTNMRSIIERMSKLDQRLFFCDVRKFDFKEWGPEYLLGLRMYLANENPAEMDRKVAKKRYATMLLLHKLFIIMFYALHIGLAYFFMKLLGLNKIIHLDI